MKRFEVNLPNNKGVLAVYVSDGFKKRNLKKFKKAIEEHTEVGFAKTLIPRLKYLSNNKKEFLEEWSLLFEFSEGGTYSCLCNECFLKTAYFIENTENSNIVYVGSDCITRFDDSRFNEDLLILSRFKYHMRQHTLGEHKGYTLPIPSMRTIRDVMGHKKAREIKVLIDKADLIEKWVEKSKASYYYVNAKKSPELLTQMILMYEKMLVSKLEAVDING